MPLSKGKESVGKNITEMRSGPKYGKIQKKYGKQKAEEVARAAALRSALGAPKIGP